MSDQVVTIETDVAKRMSINVVNAAGAGAGYRLAGRKFDGMGSNAVVTATLTQRDADEIRAHLDRVFPNPALAKVRADTLEEAAKVVESCVGCTTEPLQECAKDGDGAAQFFGKMHARQIRNLSPTEIAYNRPGISPALPKEG